MGHRVCPHGPLVMRFANRVDNLIGDGWQK